MIQDIRFWVEQKLAWLVQYGQVTVATSNGNDAVSGRVNGVQQYARRFWPWGLRSVPPVGSESITLGVDGSASNKVMVAAESTKRTSAGLEYSYGPKDLKEGETALYDKAGSVIRQSQDGTTKIDAAPNKDVILNGGTAKVARVGDHAKVTIRSVYTVVTMTPPTFALTVLAVSGTSATVLFQFTGLGTVSIPPAPGVNYDVEVDSEIFEGAPHVKA